MKKIKFYQYLNKSSKLLIFLSLAGILTSLLGLYQTFFKKTEDLEENEAIAKITLPKSDTRVKRSGNMHWYQVNNEINCYRDDIVFTGNDSTATIEFPSGDKIYLLPNSLISVSPQLVILENGAIEIDVSGTKPMELEANGKTVKIIKPAKFKILQTHKERKIVPIKGNAPKPEELGITEIKLPKIKEIFEILYPREAEVVPSLPNSKLTMEWQYTGDDQKFEIEIAGRKYDVIGSRLQIDRKDIPLGKNSWKVTNKNGETVDSFFEMTDDYPISLRYPQDNQEIFQESTAEREIEFNWNNPIGLPQVFELSQDLSFNNILISREASSTSLKLNLGEGTFFWRVGYREGQQTSYWSEVKSFKLSPTAQAAIAFVEVPPIWDFVLNPILSLNIDFSYGIEKLTFELSGPISLRGKLEQKILNLEHLTDGFYKVQIFGLYKDKEVKSRLHEFQVKNSKPISPPLIKKKKTRIFVKAFLNVLDIFISSAQAETKHPHQLNWEGESDAEYEIQIWNNLKSSLISQKTIIGNSYQFNIPAIGKYFWRVRKKNNLEWGSYSEFAEIDVKDKIVRYDQPLMLSATQDGAKITFTWNEPQPDFTYYLEIFKGQSSTPFISKKVKGGRSTFTQKFSHGSYYWRIKAISSWGTENPNKDKNYIEVNNKKIIKGNENSDLISIRTGYLLTQYNYSQEVSNNNTQNIDKDKLITGSSLQIRGDFWPKKFDHKYGLNFNLKNHSLNSNNTKISDLELLMEAGLALKRELNRSHLIFGGISYYSFSIESNDTDGEFTTSFVTARYQFNQKFSDKFSSTSEVSILQELRSEFDSPSLRLSQMMNWHFSKNWFISPIVILERNRLKLQYVDDSKKGNLNLLNTIISYGLAINWTSF